MFTTKTLHSDSLRNRGWRIWKGPNGSVFQITVGEERNSQIAYRPLESGPGVTFSVQGNDAMTRPGLEPRPWILKPDHPTTTTPHLSLLETARTKGICRGQSGVNTSRFILSDVWGILNQDVSPHFGQFRGNANKRLFCNEDGTSTALSGLGVSFYHIGSCNK